jgi:hypothetical protein
MPAIIVFGPAASGESEGQGARSETLRVSDDAEAVARKLGASKSGFVSFETAAKSPRTVWVNAAQVRMVRELRKGKG